LIEVETKHYEHISCGSLNDVNQTTTKNTNSRVTTNKSWRTTCEEGDHHRVEQVLEEDQDHNLEYHQHEEHECEKEYQQSKGLKK
jgi:hypothetical protein